MVFLRLYCDNKSAISIAHNLVQHDQTKYIEVDRHFIKDKLNIGLICTPFVSSSDQRVDIFTKGLFKPAYDKLVSKLGMDTHQLEGECRNCHEKKKGIRILILE